MFQQIGQFQLSPGYLAELEFQLLCWRNGWDCAKSIFSSPPYDFLISGYKDLGWVSIQVKKAFKHRGRYRIDIRKKSNQGRISYNKGDFDYLAVFLEDQKVWYIIPYTEISKVKSEISITKTKSKWSKYKI